MKNSDFAILIVAILFIALASSGMNMITGSSSVTAEAGSVIEIPWEYKYDNGDWFGYTTSARMMIDERGFGDGVDYKIWSQVVTSEHIYSGSKNYQVPDTEGTYKIKIYSEELVGSSWTETGEFLITITVTPASYVESDVPINETVIDTDTGSGVVSDAVPADKSMDEIIVGGTFADKLCLLLDLFIMFFENLFGGIK